MAKLYVCVRGENPLLLEILHHRNLKQKIILLKLYERIILFCLVTARRLIHCTL